MSVVVWVRLIVSWSGIDCKCITVSVIVIITVVQVWQMVNVSVTVSVSDWLNMRDIVSVSTVTLIVWDCKS